MNPCSLDIKDILTEDEDLGLVYGSNLYISREPSEPLVCTTIYDPPGGSVDLTAETKSEGAYSRHPVQVRVRDVDYLTAMTKAQMIMDRLNGLNNFDLNNTFYALIRCTTPPTLLEWSENNRVIIVINFEIQRRRLV